MRRVGMGSDLYFKKSGAKKRMNWRKIRLEGARDQLGVIQKSRQEIEYLRMEARLRSFPAISTLQGWGKALR